jgi:hypothetical protein
VEGNICYELKTPYRNGTTHMLFDPLDFISKLAALIPVPRANLTRFHGVFAPNSRYRTAITNQYGQDRWQDEYCLACVNCTNNQLASTFT